MSEQKFRAESVDDTAGIQRRTVRVLMACVIPAGMGTSGAYAGAAVLAEDLTNSGALAGIAAAGYGVGAALATLPLARHIARHGRRSGLARGWTAASIGAATAASAAIFSFYPLLVIGTVLVGAGNATTLTARYAGSDLASEDTRARAIGIIVWASAFGSVFGPTVGLGESPSGLAYRNSPGRTYFLPDVTSFRLGGGGRADVTSFRWVRLGAAMTSLRLAEFAG